MATGPLLRIRVLHLGHQDYRLIRTSHHIVSDPSSWKIFFDELKVLYEARVAGQASPLRYLPTLQFADYAHWEHTRRDQEPARYEAAVAHWQRTLVSPPPRLVLPLGPPATDQGESPRPGLVRWGLPEADADRLDRVARQANATYVMSRLAVYGALLAHESATDDVCIGMSVSMRNRSDLQQIFGPLTNYGVIRCRGSADHTFRQWLGQVRSGVIDMHTHCDFPFALVAPELVRRGYVLPAVQALFAVARPLGVLRFGGLEVTAQVRDCPDLQVFRVGMNPTYEQDRCWAEFDPTLHNAGAVSRLLHRLAALGAMVAADPDRPLREVCAALPD
jgi:hypothetical protein